jgi:hypothetical protein
LTKKAKQYPTHYKSDRMARYRQDIANDQICGDCVNGAIKGAIWSELGTRSPVYKSHDCPDKSADGMYEYCKKLGMPNGVIGTMPDKIGVAVRFKGHVGIYVGNGEVVEWRGFKYGCVVTKLASRPWTHWYELPWTEYVGDVASASPDVIYKLGSRLLARGSEGEDVKELQTALKGLGYDCGAVDGEYGKNTEKAVKAFQTAHKLSVDGDYGPITHKAMVADLGAQKGAQGVKMVRVTGGSVNVRSAPNTDGKRLGVVHKGDLIQYGGVTWSNGWHLIAFDNQNAWISGDYSELEG